MHGPKRRAHQVLRGLAQKFPPLSRGRTERLRSLKRGGGGGGCKMLRNFDFPVL